MATMTISLPDPMKEWIEARIKQGDYASTSDYVRDLVRRDRERRTQPELTIEDLRRIVDESRASGPSRRKVPDILARAKQHAQADQLLDG
ncbi:type II toxin-antitoxin system ParD family antitoxin [Methylobacterium sp. J-088]|uniref:type II toxin-antitoxin system ParD family antitoxin n=1 Tax=unclassified Methylobacterium TaxID=2615210 RepID=UPI001FB86778|nr:MULTISPECIES: type II toxin-antitoxin system ParD family antitoxin [unclassified Methylobacterium]MCJ2064644.1 type II toxin-antitoxin system ParD family antitoxin [Methylobacterium sp. J-088]